MAEAPPNRAEEALKKLAAQLECGICFEEYKDPKLLSCFHVFCKQCLERLVVQAHGQPTLQCPNCRGTTTLPSQGVSGLQSDFRMHNLFEIRDVFEKVKEPQQTQCENCEKKHSTTICQDCSVLLCQECADIHKKWKSSRNHKIVTITDIQASADVASIISRKSKVSCQKHPESVCKIYCETCREMICSDCTIRLHRDHQYDLISDTFPKYKQEILASLETVKHDLATVKKALQALDKRKKEISDQKVATETDIDEQINQLQQSLEKRRTELKGQLDKLTQHKLKGLAAQRDQVELLHTQLASCLEYVEGSLKTGTQGEILEMKAPVLKNIQQMTAEFKPDTLVPKEEADMLLISDDIPDLNRACCEVAEVVQGHVACARKSYVSGEGKKTTVGEPTTVTFHAIDRYGKECQKTVTEITSELVSCTDTTTTKCQVRREGKSKYEIQYQPATRGKHQLHIRINGKSIKGSPYTVLARPPLQSLGKPVKIIGNIKSPLGIATNSKGEIIVIESGANCVSIFAPEGQKIRTFGNPGAAHGQFSIPWGIAVVEDDSLIIVDYGNHRIQKFTSNGNFISSVGTQGTNPLQFQSPIGITCNYKTGKLYVSEYGNHRVQILNRDLTFSSTFGSQGSGNEQFQCPYDIATDSDGNVYVADTDNHCIKVFTPEGKLLRKFGSQGSGTGQLNRPTGITIDCHDTVYIVDNGNCQVSLFTTQGQFLKSFGSRGSAEGQFNNSHRITVHDDGSILVTDYGNSRIQIF